MVHSLSLKSSQMSIPKKAVKDTDEQYAAKLVKHIEELNETHSTEKGELTEAHKTELASKDTEITALKEAHKTEIEAKDAEIQKLETSISETKTETEAVIKELKSAPAVKTVDGSYEYEGEKYGFKDGYIKTLIPAHLGPFTVKVEGADKTFKGKDVIPSDLALQVPTLMEYLIEIGYGGLHTV